MLKAPFPYFGGKSRVCEEVWSRFGDVRNYVEPFFGSGAVLLGRPLPFDGVETVNDKDGLLANFWRAMTMHPEKVAHHADWPVNEADLHARHLWLLGQRESLTDRLMGDADYCDPKAAGWWVWGCSAWIGSGWCSGDGPWQSVDGLLVKVDAGTGINRQLPRVGDAGTGINRQLPRVGNAGMGINRQLPHVGDAGTGINRQLPHLDGLGYGRGINTNPANARERSKARAHLLPIADRMRDVRVACGDWTRVLGDSVMRAGTHCAVFLDPPYDDGALDYSIGGRGIGADVREWCLANGARPGLRIALCGYEGDHEKLEAHGWSVHAWKAKGGYGSQSEGDGRENSARERIWFSPHCLSENQGRLF
jgi:hypothetical protein